MYMLRARAGAPLAAIQAQLSRLRADEIALELPLGESAVLAEGAALRQLALFCQSIGKRITIIGGDEILRARAVAAGFVVATALEDHEQRTPDSTLRHRPYETWEDAYARFAARRTPRPSRPRENEPSLDEPPDFVRRLLADQPDSAYARPEHLPLVQRAPRTTRKLGAVVDRDIDVRDLCESDEDRLTENIRTTGTWAQARSGAHLTLLPKRSDATPASQGPI